MHCYSLFRYYYAYLEDYKLKSFVKSWFELLIKYVPNFLALNIVVSYNISFSKNKIDWTWSHVKNLYIISRNWKMMQLDFSLALIWVWSLIISLFEMRAYWHHWSIIVFLNHKRKEMISYETIQNFQRMIEFLKINLTKNSEMVQKYRKFVWKSWLYLREILNYYSKYCICFINSKLFEEKSWTRL